MITESTPVECGRKDRRSVKISLTQIQYSYGWRRCLALAGRCIFAASAQCEPQKSSHQVGKVDVRKLAIRPLGYRIKISNQRKQHGGTGQPGHDLGSRAENLAVAQVARQGKATPGVGDAKTVGRQ